MQAPGLIHALENSGAISLPSSAIVLQLAMQFPYTLSLISAFFYRAEGQLLTLNSHKLVALWLDKVASGIGFFMVSDSAFKKVIFSGLKQLAPDVLVPIFTPDQDVIFIGFKPSRDMPMGLAASQSGPSFGAHFPVAPLALFGPMAFLSGAQGVVREDAVVFTSAGPDC
jgi:hypothetical protein